MLTLPSVVLSYTVRTICPDDDVGGNSLIAIKNDTGFVLGLKVLVDPTT